MTARDQIIKNVDSLIQQTAHLKGVLDRLEEANIRCGLYAGSHVAVLTNNRSPTDVDFLVHDDDIDKLREIFPFATSNESESATFLYVDDDNLIEFMGRANVHKGHAIYPFRLTDLAVQHLATYTAKLGTIKIVNPVDTLLLKAILQRGMSQGKHDLEDMQAVLARVAIDEEYLRARMKETKSAVLLRDAGRFQLNGEALTELE
jgi:hypothetical protein